MLRQLLGWDESCGRRWGLGWCLFGFVCGCCEELLFVEEAKQLLLLRDDILHERWHELDLLRVCLVLSAGLAQ